MPAVSPTDYALVVGIDEYADPDLRLQGAKNDAEAFSNWLGTQNIKADVLLSDAQATVPTFQHFLNSVRKLLAVRGHRLWIFLAGHGVGPSLDEAGLLTVDATENAPTYFAGRRHANLFRMLALFDEVILCMD